MDSDFIPIAQVPFFDVTDVNSVDAAFAGAQQLEFKPAARLPQGAVFCGGKVFLGWTADCLAMDARLDDKAVWTAARHRNEPLFMLGDTLELFAAALTGFILNCAWLGRAPLKLFGGRAGVSWRQMRLCAPLSQQERRFCFCSSRLMRLSNGCSCCRRNLFSWWCFFWLGVQACL
jgi:hypothetical protein